MRALITNDDGIESVGLTTLATAALAADLEVLVAAPSWDSSGASASLTAVEQDGSFLVREVGLDGVDARCVAVEAAPAFIVRAGLSEAFGPSPDLVLSGVNTGPNTGHSVLHSGTVGAAATAATLGIPAAAFSLDVSGGSSAQWDTAFDAAMSFLETIEWQRHRGLVLNVNIPNVAVEDVRGAKVADLAPFGAVTAAVTEIGEGHVSMQYTAPTEAAGPGTDVALLAEGYVTVTGLEPLGQRDGVTLRDEVATPDPGLM